MIYLSIDAVLWAKIQLDLGYPIPFALAVCITLHHWPGPFYLHINFFNDIITSVDFNKGVRLCLQLIPLIIHLIIL